MASTKQARFFKVYRDRLFFQDDCDNVIRQLKALNASKVKVTILGNDKAVTFDATDSATVKIRQWFTDSKSKLSYDSKIEYRYHNGENVVSEFI